MKKIKSVSLGALLLGIVSFIASSIGGIASEKSNDSEVSNKTLPKEEISLKNINFEGVFDGLEILKDFSVPITEKEGVKEILSKHVDEVYGPFNRKLKYSPSISYRIVHEGDELSFVKFNVVEGNSGDKQGDASVQGGDCPDGLEYVTTCYSESCVRETLAELGKDFSDGESIYLHHDGFGGVIICSDVK